MHLCHILPRSTTCCSLIWSTKLSICHQLIELQFLDFFVFDLNLCLVISELLSKAFDLFLHVFLLLFLFCREELIDFQLTVKFLFEVFDHVTHLSDVIFELIVFHFGTRHGFDMFFYLLVVLLQFRLL